MLSRVAIFSLGGEMQRGGRFYQSLPYTKIISSLPRVKAEDSEEIIGCPYFPVIPVIYFLIFHTWDLSIHLSKRTLALKFPTA